MSSVQGLALANGRPCVGVASLDLLAAGAVRRSRRWWPSWTRSVVRCSPESTTTWGSSGESGGRHPVEDLAGGARGRGGLRGRRRVALPRRARGSRRRSDRFPEVDLFLAARPRAGGGSRSCRPGAGVPPGDLRPLYLRGRPHPEAPALSQALWLGRATSEDPPAPRRPGGRLPHPPLDPAAVPGRGRPWLPRAQFWSCGAPRRADRWGDVRGLLRVPPRGRRDAHPQRRRRTPRCAAAGWLAGSSSWP